MRSTMALAVLSVVSFGIREASAGILLQDDFNDNSLDGSKWTTNLSGPRGPASVVETNQRIEDTNRGYLITNPQFNPLTQGPLEITGQWTILGADNPTHDILAMLTRSDGIPSGSYGETYNGIEFQINGADAISINTTVNGARTQLATQDLVVNSGDVFSFDIHDDGANLSFLVQQVGGSGRNALITASSSLAFAANHVVFHNREATEGSHTSYLDNVVISQVPEPSSLTLAALGAVGIVVYALKQGLRRTLA